MRSSFIADTGQKLVRTPNPRRQAARRRLAAALTATGLGLAAVAWGYFATPREAGVQFGPFSYIPSE